MYTVYKLNGEITKIVDCQPDVINLNVSNDEFYIQGEYNDSLFYILDNVPVEKPEKPSDHLNYIFNYENKLWEADLEALVKEQKIKRTLLLQASDWTDTLSAKSRLGDSLYDQWQEYRQLLRDITAQEGFPENILWPTPPN